MFNDSFQKSCYNSEKVKIMKKFIESILFFSLVLISVFSCKMPDNKGRLCVQNNSSVETDLISQVYVNSEYGAKGSLYWDDSENGLAVGKSASFYIEEGEYYVTVVVKKLKSVLSNEYETKEFQFGYKNPVKVKEDSVTIIKYDGTGIYN